MDASETRHARLEKMRKALEEVQPTEEVKPTEPVEETPATSPNKKEGDCKDCRKKMRKDELPTDSSAGSGDVTVEVGDTDVGKCNCKQGYHRTASGKCCDSNGKCTGGWESEGTSVTHRQSRHRDRGRFANPNPKSVRKFLADLTSDNVIKSDNAMSKTFYDMVKPSFLDTYDKSMFKSRKDMEDTIAMNVYAIQGQMRKSVTNGLILRKLDTLNTNAVTINLVNAVIKNSELPADADEQEEQIEEGQANNNALPADADGFKDDKEVEEKEEDVLPEEANDQEDVKQASIHKEEKEVPIKDDDVVEIEEEDGKKVVEIESKEEHEEEVKEGEESEDDDLNKSDCGCEDEVEEMKKSELPEANEQQDEVESKPKDQEVLPTDADEQQEAQEGAPKNEDVLPEEANDQQDEKQAGVKKQSVTPGGSEKYDGRQNYNQSPMMRQAIDSHFAKKPEEDSAESELVKSFNERIATIQGQRRNPTVAKSAVPKVHGRQ